MSINTGKYLEDEIEKVLKKNKDLDTYWIRLPDAAGARGRVAAQPADYFLCQDGSPMYLEAKSQKGKSHRLRKFTQEAAMRRWELAGVRGFLIVHFHELDVIYVVRIKYLESGKPSWLLNRDNALEVGSVYEAIEFILGR